jgi:hypothetical protein
MSREFLLSQEDSNVAVVIFYVFCSWLSTDNQLRGSLILIGQAALILCALLQGYLLTLYGAAGQCMLCPVMRLSSSLLDLWFMGHLHY